MSVITMIKEKTVKFQYRKSVLNDYNSAIAKHAKPLAVSPLTTPNHKVHFVLEMLKRYLKAFASKLTDYHASLVMTKPKIILKQGLHSLSP